MHSNTLQGFIFFSIFNENPNLPPPPFESPSVVSKYAEVLFQDISKIWKDVLENYCFAKLMQSLWKKKMRPLISFSGVIVTDNPLQTLTRPSASWMIFHGFMGSRKLAFWQLDQTSPSTKVDFLLGALPAECVWCDYLVRGKSSMTIALSNQV